MERRRKMQTTFMKLAIEEAKKGARHTFTNPVLLRSLKIKLALSELQIS